MTRVSPLCWIPLNWLGLKHRWVGSGVPQVFLDVSHWKSNNASITLGARVASSKSLLNKISFRSKDGEVRGLEVVNKSRVRSTGLILEMGIFSRWGEMSMWRKVPFKVSRMKWIMCSWLWTLYCDLEDSSKHRYSRKRLNPLDKYIYLGKDEIIIHNVYSLILNNFRVHGHCYWTWYLNTDS